MAKEGEEKEQLQQKMSVTSSADKSFLASTSIDKRSKSPLLGFFWDLVSKKPNVRHEVTYKMLKFLEQTQKAHRSSDKITSQSWDTLLGQFQEHFESYSIENTASPMATEEENESDEEDDAEKCLELEKNIFSADIVYSLKRLVRGLPSSREAARQGFALALSELLGLVSECVPLGYILHLIHSNLKISGGMKGEEEKDIYLGILFGYMAIVKSGLLLQKSSKPKMVTEMLNYVLHMAEKKSFLSELCAQIITDIAESLKKSENEDHQCQLLNFIDSRLNCDVDGTAKCKLFGQGETPEAIFIYMRLSKLYPSWDWGHLLKGWKHSNLLHTSNQKHLAQVLKETVKSHPNIHILWYAILEQGLEDSEFSLVDFWNNVIDEHFMGSSSLNQKYLGFMLFERILDLYSRKTEKTGNLNREEIPLYFTKNFSRTLFNHLTQKDNYLNKCAEHLFSFLEQICRESPDLSYFVIMGLLTSHPGSIDHMTKSKKLDTLITTLEEKGADEYLNFLMQLFCDPDAIHKAQQDNVGGKSPSSDHHRNWAIDQALSIIRHSKIKKSKEALESFMELVIKTVFLTRDNVKLGNGLTLCHASLSDKIVSQMQGRFNSILSTYLNLQQLESNTVDWLKFIVEELIKLHDTNRQSFRLQFDDKNYLPKIIGELQNFLRCLDQEATQAKDASAKKQAKAFEKLFLHSFIALLLQSQEAEEMFLDVKECYMKRSGESGVDDSAAHPTDVLVDLMISFLAKESNLWRKIAEECFKVFCSEMTEEGMDLLLDVLKVSESDAADQEDIFEKDDEDSEEDENDSDSSMDVSSDDENEPPSSNNLRLMDPELQKKLQDMLESSKNDDGTQDVDDLESLHDEDMAEFDEKIAAVFSEQKKLKSQNKLAKQQMINFKLRVLDLITCYLRKCPENRVILVKCFEPLTNLYFTCIASADTALAPVASKTKSVLETLFKGPGIALDSKEDKKLMGEFIEGLFGRAMKPCPKGVKANSQTTDYHNIVSLGLTYLTKCVCLSESESSASSIKTTSKKSSKSSSSSLKSVIREKYETALEDYLGNKHSPVSPSLFKHLFNRNSGFAITFSVPILVKFAKFQSDKWKPFVTVKSWTYLLDLLRSPQIKKDDIRMDWMVELSSCFTSNLSGFENRDFLVVALQVMKRAFDLDATLLYPFKNDRLVADLKSILESQENKNRKNILQETLKLLQRPEIIEPIKLQSSTDEAFTSSVALETTKKSRKSSSTTKSERQPKKKVKKQ